MLYLQKKNLLIVLFTAYCCFYANAQLRGVYHLEKGLGGSWDVWGYYTFEEDGNYEYTFGTDILIEEVKGSYQLQGDSVFLYPNSSFQGRKQNLQKDTLYRIDSLQLKNKYKHHFIKSRVTDENGGLTHHYNWRSRIVRGQYPGMSSILYQEKFFLDGWVSTYHDNGVLKQLVYYQLGRKEGKELIFGHFGDLLEEKYWEHGFPTGTWYFYEERETIIKVIHHKANSKIEYTINEHWEVGVGKKWVKTIHRRGKKEPKTLMVPHNPFLKKEIKPFYKE